MTVETFNKVLGAALLIVAVWLAVFYGLSYDPEIRVYIDNPASEEINVFKSCEGITVTSKEEAADYVVTTELRVGENIYIRSYELSVATADGDFIFSKRNRDLNALILDACGAIRSQ